VPPQVELINRVRAIAGEIFDRAADRARFSGQADCLGRRLRRVGEAVLQIGIHRQVGGGGNIAAVINHFAARHGAVGAPEHVGKSEAGGRQRLEAKCRQQSRGAGIPGVGDDEGVGPRVQRTERRGFLALSTHCLVGSRSFASP